MSLACKQSVENMQNELLNNNFYAKRYLDMSKIPNKIYYNLINHNGEVIAG